MTYLSFFLRAVRNCLILILILLIFVIPFHELGHYVAARLTGMPVTGIAVGFGRNLVTFHAGGVDWLVNMIPLGMYVQTEAVAILNAGYWSKMFFASAGLMVNLLCAFIFWLLLRTGIHRYAKVAFAILGMLHIDILLFNILPMPGFDGSKLFIFTLSLFLPDSFLMGKVFLITSYALSFVILLLSPGLVRQVIKLYSPPE